MTLITVIIAIALSHSVRGIAGLRTLGWYTRYVEMLNARLVKSRFWDGPGGLVIVVVPLVLAVALLQAYLTGLAGFLFAIVVLVYAWGSRDLDEDVEQYLEALDEGDMERARAHAQHLVGAEVSEDHTGRDLVAGIVDESLRRWFGVLLWFCLFGATGAATFRLLQKLSEGVELTWDLPKGLHDSAVLLYRALAWPAAVLEALALAVSTDFDTVMQNWRKWYRREDQSFFSLDPSFLGAVGAATVGALQTEEDETSSESGWYVRCAMRILWRALIVWLTVLALLTLVGLAR